jgi:hypothetical protein
LAAIRGSDPAPFRFTTLGQLATIGHHAGVAEILGLRLSGFLAWCAMENDLPGQAADVSEKAARGIALDCSTSPFREISRNT